MPWVREGPAERRALPLGPVGCSLTVQSWRAHVRERLVNGWKRRGTSAAIPHAYYVKESDMLRRFAWALSPAALLFALTGPAEAGYTIKSTFNTDAEGWTVVGGSGLSVGYNATGGNPGGYISVTDTIGGTQPWYWSAPDKFLGSMNNFAGGTLSFDLRQHLQPGESVNQYDASDVVLKGGGLTLVHEVHLNPAMDGTWTHYGVDLSEVGWHIGTEAGIAATAADMTQVLSSLTRLGIRGEYQNGPNIGDLDNVVMHNTPEPPSLALMGLGAAGLAGYGWWRRRAGAVPHRLVPA